jgi:5-(aminomethyl)-3-furanmethanol phosphate kinase
MYSLDIPPADATARWVVKLGGSLLRAPALKSWLAMLGECGRGKCVIVPGGGVFADAVRAAQAPLGFDDRSAHRMALLAMAQCGYALCGMQPALTPVQSVNAVGTALARGQVPVWLPLDLLATHAGVEESWRMSADSLAAWLAQQIKAQRLVLVKHTAIERGARMEALATAGVVDELFLEHTREAAFAVEVVDSDAIEQMRMAL